MGENSGMQDMIERVNKLQDSFSQLGIEFSYDLPQIAVIGGQSAGKSSVLESFVGRDFLPRGSGVVTRRPLILQLVNDPSEEYAVFMHSPTKFTNFGQVCDEILAETWKETGNNNGISSRPINLKIHSPNVLTLTLIDLPGIIKVPHPDQPQDIENQIHEMIMTYISQPTCLILAVTSGNQDLATSDALKLAREVDPDGKRTIGVITKLDLMDDGTDALNILQGSFLPLRRGYVGVVNRSQRDIDAKVNIKAALEAEDEFFRRHPKYGPMADRLGSRFLQKLLNQELNEHIRLNLPELRSTFQEKLAEVNRTLEEYVPIIPENVNLSKLLLEIISGLRDSFELEVGRSSSVKVDTSELGGGAKINRILNDEYPKRVGNMVLMNEELCFEIAMAIQNVHGIYLGIFTPDMAFEAVIRKQIERFQEPSLECIDRVSGVLVQIIHNCAAKLHAYPKLRASVQTVINKHIKECQQEAKQRLMYMVQVQNSYMNTNHEDFVGIHAMEKVMPSYDEPQGEANSAAELNRMSAGFKERSGFMTLLLEKTNTSPATSVRCWGKLTWDLLSFYRDDKETEKINMIAGLHDWAVKPGTNARSLTLTQSRLGKQVELSFDHQNDLTNWVTALVKAGVQPGSGNSAVATPAPSPPVSTRRPENRSPGTSTNTTPSEMHAPVEIIRKLVESYVAIMRKTFKDYMPKIVMHSMINSIRRFISSELLVELRAHGEEKELMTGDPEVELKQRNLLLRKAAINNAINLIDEPYSNY